MYATFERGHSNVNTDHVANTNSCNNSLHEVAEKGSATSS